MIRCWLGFHRWTWRGEKGVGAWGINGEYLHCARCGFTVTFPLSRFDEVGPPRCQGGHEMSETP